MGAHIVYLFHFSSAPPFCVILQLAWHSRQVCVTSLNNSHRAAASVAANEDLVIYYRCLVSCPFSSAELRTSEVCGLRSLFRLACWAEVMMCGF